MDVLAGLVFFVNPVRAAHMGASFAVCAGFGAAWGLIYTVCCPVVGSFVTVANAGTVMTISCALGVVTFLLFMATSSILVMYLLMGLMAVVCAMFFTPFQVFMKSLDAGGNRSLHSSVGAYTFAWSAGIAVGPLIAGFLMQLGKPVDASGSEPWGWRYCYIVSAVGAAATGIAVWLADKRRIRIPLESTSSPSSAETARDARPPDLARLGWIAVAAAVLLIAIFRGILPKGALQLGINSSTQGVIFFIFSIMQGITGLALIKSGNWMYRALPVGAFGLVGIAGFLLIGYGTTSAAMMVGALLGGFSSGAVFFYVVYHSLVHPTRSARYVSIQESVIGAAGVVGPLVGGMLADQMGYAFPYLAGCAVLAGTVGFQMIVHARRPWGGRKQGGGHVR